MNTFSNIYKLVQKVPPGKVTTYGEIARKLNISPRVVGFALHSNPDPSSIPCHRVVDRTGKIAKSFAFGGENKQREILLLEGTPFKDTYHVNIKNVYKYR